MYEYSQSCLEEFLKRQGKLFDEPVAETLEEAEEFLEDCMAVVVDSLKEVCDYLEESGMDISGLSLDEIRELEEVFELEDGTYTADFNTDSNMFHVNEAKEGKGVLTVKDGKMTIHISLVSKNIVNVFVGTKEEAQADGAELIEPTTDEVTYSDGTTDEVYGFDIPVEKLDEDFNVAIIGKKGTWYDHVVSVSNPVPQE